MKGMLLPPAQPPTCCQQLAASGSRTIAVFKLPDYHVRGSSPLSLRCTAEKPACAKDPSKERGKGGRGGRRGGGKEIGRHHDYRDG